ncbi:RHS repeat-associated core domain-containing protein [Pseudomonas sp. YNh]|uniref:RHS repeat-associated core domain-containing protein n=1 Tax=Pseudomonas sp. YNh TaxID=3133145 RepID=UPI0030F1FAA9
MNRSPKRSLFFYQDDKLLTRLQGDEPCSLFRMGDITLAERNVKGTASTLLTSDIKGSTFGTAQASANHSHAYTPYGFCTELYSLLGFNGEYFDRVLGDYVPHSYRIYNSRLMRFHSTDDLSPFLKGGLNPYTFCSGDPINYSDPTGHAPISNSHIQSVTYIQTSKTKISFQGPEDARFHVTTKKIANHAVFDVFTDKNRTATVPVLENQYREYTKNQRFITNFHELKKTPEGRTIIRNQYLQHAAKSLDDEGRPTRDFYTFSPKPLVQDAQNTNAYIVSTAERLLKKALDPKDETADIRSFTSGSGNSRRHSI